MVLYTKTAITSRKTISQHMHISRIGKNLTAKADRACLKRKFAKWRNDVKDKSQSYTV